MTPPSDFLFAICQAGAEAALRKELAGSAETTNGFGPLKPAFSRPGFVTFKVDPVAPPPERYTLRSTLARTYGWSLGKVNGNDAASMVEEIVSNRQIAECEFLHVFERDKQIPGTSGFEPGVSPLAASVADQFAAHSLIKKRSTKVNRRAATDAAVADVVLISPDEWWFGFHHALTRQGRWPGGVPAIDTEEEHVSRAYLKLKEALLWSGITIRPGDVCAEIGSAPGGACELLLEIGARVIAIDPAEMEPSIEEHPKLTFIRRRGHEVRKRDFSNVRWLLADLNMAPKYTLDTVRDIVTHDAVNVSGLLLTLKHDDWKLIERVGEYIETVKAMGFQVVRTRQLAFNRREFCLIAIKDKFTLRTGRRKGRTSRIKERTAPIAESKKEPGSTPVIGGQAMSEALQNANKPENACRPSDKKDTGQEKAKKNKTRTGNPKTEKIEKDKSRNKNKSKNKGGRKK